MWVKESLPALRKSYRARFFPGVEHILFPSENNLTREYCFFSRPRKFFLGAAIILQCLMGFLGRENLTRGSGFFGLRGNLFGRIPVKKFLLGGPGRILCGVPVLSRQRIVFFGLKRTLRGLIRGFATVRFFWRAEESSCAQFFSMRLEDSLGGPAN